MASQSADWLKVSVVGIEKSGGKIGSSHGIQQCRDGEFKMKKTYTVASGIVFILHILQGAILFRY